MPNVLPVPNPYSWNPGDKVTAPRLRDTATAVAFHTSRPAFYATQAAAQSIPNSTWTGITLDNAFVDNVGGHSNSTNNSRYTAQVAGWYLAIGSIPYPSLSTANTDSFIAGVRVNGLNDNAHLFEGTKHTGANTHGIQPMIIEIVKLNVGDYVELATFQITGAAQTLVSSGGVLPNTPQINAYLSLSWVAAVSGTTGLPVPSEATWIDGPGVTAAALNSNVRDAIRFLTYPPIARLYYTGTTPAGQNFPNNAFTAVSFDSVTVDNYTGWAGTGTNPTRWTAPVAGHHLVVGYASFGNSTAGKRGAALRVNGTTTYYGQTTPAITTSGNDAGNCMLAQRFLKLNAGDWVETMGYQNTGGNLSMTTGTSTNRLIVVWMAS